MPTPGLDGYLPPWQKPEHDDLAALARDFFTKEVLPHAERLERQGHPDREHYRRAGELGLLGLSVPEEYGGGGGDFTHEAVLLHEQTSAGEGSLGLAVHSGIVTGYLVAYGSEEQKRRWLPGLCSGELVGAIAMTEPGGGSDLRQGAGVPAGSAARQDRAARQRHRRAVLRRDGRAGGQPARRRGRGLRPDDAATAAGAAGHRGRRGRRHAAGGRAREYPIARMYADARVQKIYGGTNEIMKELIARVL